MLSIYGRGNIVWTKKELSPTKYTQLDRSNQVHNMISEVL